MPKRPSPFIREKSNALMEWAHFERTSEKELRILRERFGFHPVDVSAVPPPLQRPKVVFRDGYIFMILPFPLFDYRTRIINASEVDFFIAKDRLVTVNPDGLPAIQQVFDKFADKNAKRQDIAHVLLELLNTLLESQFPVLMHLSQDIDEIEKGLFRPDQHEAILELLRIKTNIVNVRKAMQGHKKIIRNLITQSEGILPMGRLEEYYNRLVDYTKEIWDELEVQRDTINALHETHASLIENRTNEVMKTLTVFSVIIFPMTLMATLFAVRLDGMPWEGDPLGFFKLITLLALLAGAMFAYFKKKRWI
jgi:magnesium transporter